MPITESKKKFKRRVDFTSTPDHQNAVGKRCANETNVPFLSSFLRSPPPPPIFSSPFSCVYCLYDMKKRCRPIKIWNSQNTNETHKIRGKYSSIRCLLCHAHRHRLMQCTIAIQRFRRLRRDGIDDMTFHVGHDPWYWRRLSSPG